MMKGKNEMSEISNRDRKARDHAKAQKKYTASKNPTHKRKCNWVRRDKEVEFDAAVARFEAEHGT